MRTTLREPLTEADALDVIYYKTTRYTFEFPMQLAGLLAGVDASGQAQLSGLARDLGLAFQLVDDRIGLFGEAAVTGKSPLSDLAEGKQTLLMIHTRERIGPADRSYLDTVLGNSAATPDDLQRVRRLVRDCGAYDAVETVIDAARRRAEATLAQADYRPDGKRFLRELTAYLTERDH
jgi:geranylgeranyl diphosphate synthase type I